MLTGQFAHSHGVIDNLTPFFSDFSWATVLKEAGYTTAYFGKWHHGRQSERPGFDYAATFRGQGKFYDTPFIVGEAGSRETQKTKGYVDEVSVDYFLDYLDAPRDKPFAAMIGLKAVHQPFTPMKEHAGIYGDERIAASPNWSAAPPWSSYRDSPPPRRPYRSFWNDILESVQGIDKNLGHILDALDAHNLTANTVVIFTSDKGYYLGEHMLGDKRSAYEESIRVPLLVKYPGVVRAGGLSDALVLNIDLAPTILDLAGAVIPDKMAGRSLRPLLSGQAADWRDAFLYEYWALPYDRERWPDSDPGIQGSLDVLNTPTMLAIRTRQHKLITYPEDDYGSELFDLANDPHETRNLAELADYADLRSELCDRLDALLGEYGYSYLWPIGQWASRSTYPDKPSSQYSSMNTASIGYSLKKC